MDNKIIDYLTYFPIKELNTILGGIKQNTEYNFFFKINDAEYENNFDEIIPQLKGIETDVIKSIKIIYNNFINEFREYYKNKDILIINVNEESEKISKYFKLHPETKLDELYNEDVMEFIDFINTAPSAKEIDKEIKMKADIQNSIFVFYFGDEENDNLRGMYFPSVPNSFQRINIDFFFGQHLIESITEYKTSKIIFEYGTLNFLEKEKNFLEKLETKDFRLFKSINVEVIKPEESKDFEEQSIHTTYSFNKRYDVKSFEIM